MNMKLYTAAGLTRRFSELTGLGSSGDTSRRNQWQSSLGFGALPEIPQSRRHSMAEMPTRRNSLVGAPGTNDQALDFASTNSNSPILQLTDPYQATLQENRESYTISLHTLLNLLTTSADQRDMQNRTYAASYFSGSTWNCTMMPSGSPSDRADIKP